MKYIEVFYLNNMRVTSKKLQQYEDKEIDVMFNRTIGKLKSENKSAFIVMREASHDLIRSELI